MCRPHRCVSEPRVGSVFWEWLMALRMCTDSASLKHKPHNKIVIKINNRDILRHEFRQFLEFAISLVLFCNKRIPWQNNICIASKKSCWLSVSADHKSDLTDARGDRLIALYGLWQIYFESLIIVAY